MTKVVFLLQKCGIIIALIFATLFYLPASAQRGGTKIDGKVLDRRSGEPLPGANILIAKDKTGVITDINGKFTIVAQEIPVELTVSFIGYRTESVDVYEYSEPLTISLSEERNLQSEVVVVGYGTQKRSDLTGSVVSLPKNILETPATSFDNLLSGAVAGVQVTQSSGQPGASASIRIRGGNSITGGNEPLYVIDGQIMYNNNSAAQTGISGSSGVSGGYLGQAGLNVLATINPADIASIDVLKDASATAIYGSRGANGVIIITTKKGVRGKDNIQYAGSTGVSVAGKKLDFLNAQEWALLRNDIIANDNLTSETPFTQAEIDALQSYDYQDAALRTAYTQNHQLSASGGDEKTQYLISLNYYDQRGIVLNTGFERYALRANLQRKFSEKFRTGLNISASSSEQTGVSGGSGGLTGAGDVFTAVLMTPPAVPIYNADGSYYIDKVYNYDVNTIANLKEITNETKVNRVFANIFAEYRIIPELTAKINVGADVISAKQNYFAPSITSAGYAVNGRAYVGASLVQAKQAEFTLTYSKHFGELHHLTALAGYTSESSYTESAVAAATNFLSDITGYNDLGGGDASQPSSDAYPWAMSSYLARLDYTYNDRYNLTASFRADGSSRFAPDNKWGFFPSLGLSWNVHEEEFLKNISQINSLKLRLSGGSIGNQEIGEFQYVQRFSPVLYGLGGKLVTGYAPDNLANGDLKWETTTQYDAGFDLGIFQNRILLTFDAYYKLTKDLLVEVPVPTTSGYTSALANIGSVSNRGIELSINADIVNSKKKGGFNWQSALVVARNRNLVESLGDDVIDYKPLVPNGNIGRFNPLIVKEGYALGTFWGYQTDGVVQLTDDLTGIPKPTWTRTATVQPGDRKYVDNGGDPTVIDEDDRVILGNAQPKFTYGFTNTFSFRSFDLLVLLQGSYGNKLYNALVSQLEVPMLAGNVLGVYRDRWTPANPTNDVPRAQNAPNVLVTDRYIEDASYLRLKTLTLGYTLPKSFVRRAKIERARLFITGQNLLLFTKYKGYDPEANTYEQQSIYQGIDYGAYPSTKGFIAGIEITL
ncbi:MAG: TonB-dependent receptor [Bacteroidales bacterium]|jgi:TonB-linked SusC/RagA family outer membrane protein|nr:TonB-dependent receptor [Bacteroidales bacterium]